MQRLTALVAALLAAGAAVTVLAPGPSAPLPSGVVSRWEAVTTADGLPDPKVFAVLATPEGIWLGTEGGLALHDRRRMTAIHQSKDGLANDLVYSVCSEGGRVWCATAAGLSRLDTATGQWTTWTEKNSPMKEIWCYGACADAGKVWIAIWGSGVLEHDVASGAWRLYRDPDGDMRFDLFRDDGLLSDVTAAVSAADGKLWVASYLGLSRYDGRDWRTWVEEDGGIASSFLNGGRANGPEYWACTDKGLSQYDGRRWVTYRPLAGSRNGRGEVIVTPEGGAATRFETETSLPGGFVWSVDFDGRDVWVGTSSGAAHGFRNGPAPTSTVHETARR